MQPSTERKRKTELENTVNIDAWGRKTHSLNEQRRQIRYDLGAAIKTHQGHRSTWRKITHTWKTLKTGASLQQTRTAPQGQTEKHSVVSKSLSWHVYVKSCQCNWKGKWPFESETMENCEGPKVPSHHTATSRRIMSWNLKNTFIIYITKKKQNLADIRNAHICWRTFRPEVSLWMSNQKSFVALDGCSLSAPAFTFKHLAVYVWLMPPSQT